MGKSMGRGRIRGARVLRNSGTVFPDLGIAESDEKKTKFRLAVAINAVLDERGLTQKEAARLLEITQPKVSALANYRLGGFSVERLMNFLAALGREVEIVIRRSRSRRRMGIHVSA